jgi:hypothetical protein
LALTHASENNLSIQMIANLYEFLDLQASHKGSTQEQATLFLYLLHSKQVYPNDPRSDPDWKGNHWILL